MYDFVYKRGKELSVTLFGHVQYSDIQFGKLFETEVGKMSVSDRSRRSLAHVADAVVNVLERITSQKHSMPSGVFLFIAGDGIPSLPRNPTKFFTPIERGDVDIEA